MKYAELKKLIEEKTDMKKWGGHYNLPYESAGLEPENEMYLAEVAYALREVKESEQNIIGVIAPAPVWSATSTASHDTCSFEIFADDSIIYYNNAENEVWPDYRDMFLERLEETLNEMSYEDYAEMEDHEFNCIEFSLAEKVGYEHPDAPAEEA